MGPFFLHSRYRNPFFVAEKQIGIQDIETHFAIRGWILEAVEAEALKMKSLVTIF